MTANKLIKGDSLKEMALFPNESVNIYYTDTPYNMGSRYKIDGKGHIVFDGKGSDFMNKWEAMDGYWWDTYFKQVARTLKYGGFWISHNIDRQSWLWCYYAVKNGLLPMQKLYWLFIDNFPKGVDVTKHIDNLLGQDRVVIGRRKGAQKISTGTYGDWGQKANEDGTFNITLGTSKIAQKYEGYKYGIASLKQSVEEILVFMKDPHTSVPKDIIAYENGKKSIHPSVLNIRDTSVLSRLDNKPKWTSQLLIHNEVIPKVLNHKNINHFEGAKLIAGLPKIEFLKEDFDEYYFFEPKISPEERDEGLENFEDSTLSDGRTKENFIANSGRKRKNPHPSPKPKRLVKWVLNLFKPPDNILVVDTFMGSGAIPQCCKEEGIDYIGIEIDDLYYKVAEAKLEYVDRKDKTLF